MPPDLDELLALDLSVPANRIVLGDELASRGRVYEAELCWAFSTAVRVRDGEVETSS